MSGRVLLALLAGLFALPVQSSAQEWVRVAVEEENVRAEPNASRVAVAQRGFVFAAGETRERWRSVTLEAWVPSRSVITNPRDGFDLIVAGGGAAMHLDRDGRPLGRLLGGVQVSEVGRAGDFVLVRRPAWIWVPSLEGGERPAALRVPEPVPAPRAPPAPRQEEPAATAAPPDPIPAASPAARVLRSGPDGDSLGVLSRSAPLEMLGRDGDWARVRVDGWVRASPEDELDADRPLRGVSLRALRDDPERHAGALLSWQVQFMALQQADSLRAEFQPREWYMLARDPGGEPGFVYIAVPASLLPAVRQFPPLQRVEVVARVRSGRSRLTGHPVLDLIEIRNRPG